MFPPSLYDVGMITNNDLILFNYCKLEFRGATRVCQHIYENSNALHKPVGYSPYELKQYFDKFYLKFTLAAERFLELKLSLQYQIFLDKAKYLATSETAEIEKSAQNREQYIRALLIQSYGVYNRLKSFSDKIINGEYSDSGFLLIYMRDYFELVDKYVHIMENALKHLNANHIYYEVLVKYTYNRMTNNLRPTP